MKRVYFSIILFLVTLGVAIVFVALTRPRAAVSIKKEKNGHYRLLVEGKPHIIKGACYSPIPIGENQEYDWWSSPEKPWLEDGKLMQGMGINSIRLYQGHENINEVKQVVRDLYENYGIRTMLGHWLGFWNYPCPFYGHQDFRERIKKEALEMVNTYKDEPGILCWVLGNENNFSCFGQVHPWSNDEIDKEPDPQKQKKMRAKIYYSFVNELAREIHKIDPHHPVVMGNGELVGLETAAEVCPDIDAVGCIIYRGKTFGNLFKSLKNTFDKPLILLEFGADAYDAHLDKEDQNMQAFFLESQWQQIYQNLAGNPAGAGNCLGGVIFEWQDEWWKHNEVDPAGWKVHDTESNWSNPSYYFDVKAKDNKNMNEEWFGIVKSPRTPRKAYYVIRDFWKNPTLANHKRKVRK